MKGMNWLWLLGLGVGGYVIYTMVKPAATPTPTAAAGAGAVPAINPSSYDSGGTAAGQAIQNAMNPS
jgi:hypothetical protein